MESLKKRVEAVSRMPNSVPLTRFQMLPFQTKGALTAPLVANVWHNSGQSISLKRCLVHQHTAR